MAKKSTHKSRPKKVVKKVAKKTTKRKVVKKVAKKAAKKVSKKVAKKVHKKVAKKVSKKVAKKTTKRKVVKKSAKRKGSRITLSMYDTKDVPEHQHFYFVNGQKVKNVKELAQVMDKLEQEVFDYHVNGEKNDFANWIKGVFNDLELAEKIVGVTGPKHLQFTIYKHVADKALKKK